MDSSAIKRLRWRCRRGLRELDLLLETWLTHHADDADDSALLEFADFLESTDMELYDWVTGRAKPQHSGFARMVDELTVYQG